MLRCLRTYARSGEEPKDGRRKRGGRCRSKTVKRVVCPLFSCLRHGNIHKEKKTDSGDNYYVYRRFGAGESRPGRLRRRIDERPLPQGTQLRLCAYDQQPDGADGGISGLEALKNDGCDVTVYSDSKYVVDAVAKGWVFGWERKGFKDKKNPDLWRRFLALYRRHNGNVSSGLRGTPKFLKTSDAIGWPWLLRRRAT